MNHKTELFLQLFNTLENALKINLKKDSYTPFSRMLFEAAKRDQFLKKNKDILDDISDLRNVLVHQEGNIIIATPSDETIEILSAIVDRYIRPRLLIELCDQQVIYIRTEKSLREALMIMEKSDFSKIPVYDENGCIGLLTGNMISRWLRKNIDSKEATEQLLDETCIKDVMTYQKDKDGISYLPREMNVNEFMNLASQNPSPSGVYMITHHGRNTERPLGIITNYDYPKIFNGKNN